jgi:mono/diheme cytochrome c family protein
VFFQSLPASIHELDVTLSPSLISTPQPGSARRTGASILALLGFAGLAMAAPASADPKASYLTRCSMCHQSAAQGLPGQFPALAGRSAQIAQTAEGRRYLVRVALWGLYGPIELDGKTISGLMPGVASASDAEIADVLTHVTSLGKPAKPAKPFKPAEVAAVRAEGKVSGTDNAALRKTLVAAGVIK